MRCGVCGKTPRTCVRTRTRTRCPPKWPPSRGRLAGYADTVDPDALVQPVEEFEALVAAARGVWREGQTLQRGEAGLGESLGALHQTVAQGNRVEGILHGGPDTDQAHAMRQESSPIASGRVGNPDGGEAVVSEQFEQVEGVSPIGLGLAHDHRPDLGGIADEQRVPELPDQRVEPE